MNPIGPRGVYDEAKRFAEAMTLAYNREHGVDTRIVRSSIPMARGCADDGRAVPAFFKAALQTALCRCSVMGPRPDPSATWTTKWRAYSGSFSPTRPVR